MARAVWDSGHWRMSAGDALRLGLDPQADQGVRVRAAPLAQGAAGAAVLPQNGMAEGDQG